MLLLVDLLAEERFRFDDPTRRLYEALGGTRELDAPAAAAANVLPPV